MTSVVSINSSYSQ